MPNVGVVEPARRSVRRINTLSEGELHAENDSDDDNVPITTTLTKPL
jgi:hypothetical protein